MAKQLSLNIEFERHCMTSERLNLSKDMKILNNNLNVLNGLNEVDDYLNFYKSIRLIYETKGGGIIGHVSEGKDEDYKEYVIRAEVSSGEIKTAINKGVECWEDYRNELIKLLYKYK